jgi:hypothetical protein
MGSSWSAWRASRMPRAAAPTTQVPRGVRPARCNPALAAARPPAKHGWRCPSHSPHVGRARRRRLPARGAGDFISGKRFRDTSLPAARPALAPTSPARAAVRPPLAPISPARAAARSRLAFRHRHWASLSAPTQLPSRQEILAGSPYVHELPWSHAVRAHQFSLNGRTSTSKVHAERGWWARWYTVIAMSSGSR